MAAQDEPPSYPLAPSFRIPSTSYASIEYPGPVASTSGSQREAIKTLGGAARLSKALHSQNGIVELNFRPDVTFSHAVGGEKVEGSSMILLKVIKKRRRRTDKTKIVGQSVLPDRGVYKIAPIGTIDKVVRFRAMADLQYQPPAATTDPTVRLGDAIRNMDVRTMQEYRFPEPAEDFEKGMRLLPPPVFSRLTLPQIYAYRANPLSAQVTVTKSDGTEATRLVNKAKYKGELPITIPFSQPISAGIPMGPAKSPAKANLEKSMLDILTKLFEKRPIWSRNALLNHVPKDEKSRLQNFKLTIPFVSWSFSDGPFRDSCIRFGYDPRQHREARFYQRIMIRNMANNRMYLKKIAGAGNSDSKAYEEDENSHIFDGVSVHGNIGNYQLCDMTDPYLHEAVQKEEFVRDECDPRDGWWDGEYIEFLRHVLKRKFFALINEGVQLPDDSFEDLVNHLHEYRAQQDLLKSAPPPPPQRVSAEEEEGREEAQDEGNAEDEQGDQMMLGQKKITSLKSKGRRLQKPKAKEAMPGHLDRTRSRFGQTAEQGAPPGNTEGEHSTGQVREES